MLDGHGSYRDLAANSDSRLESIAVIKSARVTKNLQYFIADRFKIASQTQNRHHEGSISKLPHCNSNSIRQSSKSRSHFRINRALNENHPHTRDFSVGMSNSGNDNLKSSANISTNKIYKLTTELLDKSPDSRLASVAKTEQINKNSKFVKQVLRTERAETKKILDSKTFTNVSFFRPELLPVRHSLKTLRDPSSNLEYSHRCLLTGQSEVGKEQSEYTGLAHSQRCVESNELKLPASLDFNFKSLITRIAEKNHPEDFDEVV
jgi:hypothetical protein